MSQALKTSFFLHGGDYNPDQWLEYPEILEKDVELMRRAHVNCVSVGIFAWAALEPEEGKYDFAWLDRVIDRLWKAGIHVDLATPSGARPAWMAQKYPEVLRVREDFTRNHFGTRHNHCPSSPVYREKVRAIDSALAERYGHHPAVLLWHISNEFGGDCRCELCAKRFREFLREKYGSLAELNRSWWTAFWSMRYTDWEQIEPPSTRGQSASPAMWVDWRRFSTKQCRDFIRMEKEAVQKWNPELPVTTNLMHRFGDYDYFSLAEEIDVVSWDSYPAWGSGDDLQVACDHAMEHDLMRSLKRQPFLLMESTPSMVNWHTVNKPKRPGMHLLSSMLPVALGSDSVMYFQWRKGRGGAEMFHGAVVGHDGTGETRTFREVTQVGEALEKLTQLLHSERRAEVCVLYDWQNRWALDYAQMGRRGDQKYLETVNAHYRALWTQGIAVDFCDMREVTDLSSYRLVVAPMLFMLRGGIEEKLRAFAEGGGCLVATYLTGVIGENGLAWLGETPHALTDVLGVRVLEMDTLYDQDACSLVTRDGEERVGPVCEVIDAPDADVIGTYGPEQFYAGTPCLTRHAFGHGKAFYMAARMGQEGLDRFYRKLAEELRLKKALPGRLPEGVVAQERAGWVFLMNFSGAEQRCRLDGRWTDALSGETVSAEALLPVNGVMVLRK